MQLAARWAFVSLNVVRVMAQSRRLNYDGGHTDGTGK